MNRLELNKSALKKRLSSRVLFENLEQVVVNDIQWRIEDSKNSDVLFYRIDDSAHALENFWKKIKNARYGVLILNRMPEIELKNVMVVKDNKFVDCQNIFLDVWYPSTDYLDNSAKKLVGITGTNGKTTTAHLCLHLAGQSGKKAFSIGTLGIRDTKGIIAETFTLTTPPLIELRKKLHENFKLYDVCFMEVSSHAVVQGRLMGLVFNAGAWLSFTQDHLDYHKTLKEYFKAKLDFPKSYLKEKAPLFVPAEQKDLIKKLKKYDFLKVAPTLDERKVPHLPKFFVTQFNRNNLEVALAILEHLYGSGFEYRWDEIPLPEGRFTIREIKGKTFIIDSAHTPDALVNICSAIKQSFPQKRLWILFGCGGDRDPIKRPIMGKIVCEWADQVFLTSDNPRNEDPQKIVEEVLASMDLQKTEVNIDRLQSVKLAVSRMDSNVVLLLAGKGHENYQLVKGEKIPYSDEKAIELATESEHD